MRMDDWDSQGKMRGLMGTSQRSKKISSALLPECSLVGASFHQKGGRDGHAGGWFVVRRLAMRMLEASVNATTKCC